MFIAGDESMGEDSKAEMAAQECNANAGSFCSGCASWRGEVSKENLRHFSLATRGQRR